MGVLLPRRKERSNRPVSTATATSMKNASHQRVKLTDGEPVKVHADQVEKLTVG